MKKILILAALLAPMAAYADKDHDFKKDHPRRAEVLHRANHQEKRENKAFRQGKITGKQDRQLHREDQAIKRQEQRDAAKHGGHITKAEQKQLNKEENHVNRQLKHDEKVDASAH